MERAYSKRGCQRIGLILLLALGLTSCSRLGVVDDVEQRESALNATQSGDELRTSWYPDEPGLAPSIVEGPTFGQLFSTTLDGAVYAQPLVNAGTLLVVTENNNVYGLDPQTGAIRWNKNLGVPFKASDVGCGDLAPNIGVTGTPVVDASTGIAYMFSATYGSSGGAAWYAHAIDIASGAEQPGFPVLIAGKAANEPGQTFAPATAHQRTGLLLMNGVVYAGFGSHCDFNTWTGWILGVTTTGVLQTLFATESGPNRVSGGGIWGAGGGLVSDGAGQILFSTGNGGAPSGSISGKTPPLTLGESVVRLTVQSDGSLKPTDFFAPYDAPGLDTWDADLGSCAPAALPDTMGTTQFPHLMVTSGKQGYVYLLDRDNLGGIGNGPSGGDAVLNRLGPIGGVWSKPAIWPGDGGFVYIISASSGTTPGGTSGYFNVLSYGLDGAGKPTLALVGKSTDSFGFGAGSPVVTSNGTESGSALVWLIWAANGTGAGAQLRAYDVVPTARAPVLRFSASVGTASKFVPPGIAGGRVYVGTRDGHLIAFGTTSPPQLTASPLDFGVVPLGASSTANLTLAVAGNITITGASSSPSDFVVGPLTDLPLALQQGQTASIPLTFSPSGPGSIAGTVTVTTSAGTYTFGISGQGQSKDALLTGSPSTLSLGGTTTGGQIAASVTFSNAGGAALVINAVDLPGAPFTVVGAPANGTTMSPGQSITMTITFAPLALGNFMDSIGLETSAGNKSIPISAVCSPPGHLSISSLTVPFGVVQVGQITTAQFSVTNTGGSTITILKSKPPALGPFTARTSLAEGTSLTPGTTLTETVVFAPTQPGSAADGWILNADDGGSVQTVQFSGTGVTDVTSSGQAIALITAPTGGGSKSLSVISDGFFPPVGSTNSAQQYDTYTGLTRTEDWIGYTYATARQFGQLVFQEGKQFADGGWFTNLKVQVRVGGVWTDVAGVSSTPTYPNASNTNYTTFTMTFPPVLGDGIRIDGVPGGAHTFISVGELRVWAAPAAPGQNVPPTANAGSAQSVASGATVTLDGTGSRDPNGNPITYAWTESAGPTVTLVGANTARPTFTAPTVTSPTTLTFSLTVQNGSLASAPASVTITVSPTGTSPPTLSDVTASGTAIALITAPTGGGSKSLSVISDGVFPPVGSTNSAQQYDTYTGVTRTEDWIGYTFTAAQQFGQLVFQEGKQFSDGGWFTSLKVQVRQGGVWTDVAGVSSAPTYPNASNTNYTTFTLTFPLVTGDGIRIDGVPGGAHTFISVGELRAWAATSSPPPPPTLSDVTASGTAIALITAPTGGGSKSLSVISDGVFPPVGSTNSAQQYDTYTGVTRTEDWIGYTFTAAQQFGQLVFQEGKQFADGGWFTSLKVQVRQGGVWTDVAGVSSKPTYPNASNTNYTTFTLTFPKVTGDGIRIDGVPGGAHTFISVGELRVYGS